MAQTHNNPAMSNNEIPLDQLPVQIKAYKDENGYALVLKSDDKRIGDSKGRLVDNFLVRILDGPVPIVNRAHPVSVSDAQTRHVGVADAMIDETGRLFVRSATDGVKHPVARPE